MSESSPLLVSVHRLESPVDGHPEHKETSLDKSFSYTVEVLKMERLTAVQMFILKTTNHPAFFSFTWFSGFVPFAVYF